MLDAETMRLIEQSFRAVAVIYGCAAFFSLFGLFRAGGGMRWLPRALLWIGWVVHTLALAGQWRAGGAFHPPWTNLYETLLFFPWALITAQLLFSGAASFATELFSATTAALGLGLAWLQINPGVNPVSPELHSLWIFGHSAFGFFAYSFFLVSLFFSVFFLIQDQLRSESIGVYPAALAALATVPVFYPGAPKVLHVILVASCALWAASAFFSLVASALHKPSSRKGPEPGSVRAGFLGGADEKIHWTRKALRSLHFAAFLTLVVVIVALEVTGRKTPGFGLARSPFRSAALIFVLVANLFVVLLFKHRANLETKLPATGDLDRAAYRATGLGFTLLSMSLLSGSIWAYEAWGSYWSWEPKQIWTLLLWVYYGMYLHGRATEQGTGRKAALYSALGLLVIGIAFLGVSLLFPGLHVYARG